MASGTSPRPRSSQTVPMGLGDFVGGLLALPSPRSSSGSVRFIKGRLQQIIPGGCEPARSSNPRWMPKPCTLKEMLLYCEEPVGLRGVELNIR
jgi:hypothetical protein